ncbi:MAG: hypothetical protein DIZ80_10250 [endosymbiont of Galathealinum brachiosum]|uniref:Uncharacterized protein n=1 Tax=endosymbiont of Galathealinum brachiosum TaxID=2200906 RepID=A0A370DCL0_9GAMM|nr:MAG: hypothetical protein DIZ80_10250 [endosymbiont of Galathealinum brachiosum]
MLGVMTVGSIDEHAIVNQQAELNSEELKRVKNFIRQNNPAKIKSGETTNSQINQQDLNLAAHYLSQNAPGVLNKRAFTHVMLDENLAYIQISIKLPENPAGKFINISSEIESVGENTLRLKSLNIGNLELPAYIAQPVAEYTHNFLQNNITEYNLLSQSLQKITFAKKQLMVAYVLDRKTANQLKAGLSSRVISDELKRALIAQSNNLSKVSYKLGSRPTLNEVMKPMFKLAESRSLLNDPVIENKAVFITLGAYALNKNISKLFDKKDQKPIKTKRVYLKKRFDLSRHLLVSAAIASMADSGLAESIGLEKEVKDSQGGSGFSFADLAADHAGIKLAEYSLTGEQQARKVQTKLATIKFESDYMPSIENLPEGLTKQEFDNKYANKPAYTSLEQLIKRRIDGLVMYR